MCQVTTDEMNARQVVGLYVASMAIFISLFVIVYVDYVRSYCKNNYIEWDVKTITAGDYSVEMDLPEEMYQNFEKEKFDVTLPKAKLAQFRDYLKAEMEDRLTRLPDLGYEEEPPEQIKIAMISFAFDNAEVINLLKERGSYIKSQKYDKMREMDAKIDQYIRDHMKDCARPVSCFLTFENEEGLNRAKNYNETVQKDDQFADIRKFCGVELGIEEASEPTDIIWENRHFTPMDRFYRALIVVAGVLGLLFLSFIIIFVLSVYSVQSSLKYPSVNCDDFDTMYGD